MNATTHQLTATVHTFAPLLSSSRRSVRLARLLAVEQLRTWPVSPSVTERAEQIVAELAANAALHGRVQGRDFRVALVLDPAAGTLRIAVSDARGGQLPASAGESETNDGKRAACWSSSPPLPTRGARSRTRRPEKLSGPY
ncbi:ATP-binding protein [Streptomyces europaeiscabiei]|uniref:ATP-binding protein n=1 Tax=Streptomyces europaeiscabiei TaxID=146819 RepID=UPI00399A9215